MPKRKLQFFLPLDPPTTTHQQKRVTCRGGRPVFYDSQEVKDIRLMFRYALAPYQLEKPFEAPIRLMHKWIYPVPKTRGYGDGEYKTTKPDTHNMVKIFVDEMEMMGFFKDDSHIASEIIEKFWGEVPGIFVQMEEL